MKYTVELNHVSKTFHRGLRKVEAVKDVSFYIKPGEILGLMGESGSGKSTIASMITGMTGYDGKITYGFKPRKGAVQVIFQHPRASMDSYKTIGYMLEETLETQGLQGEKRKEAALDLLDSVHLDASYLSRYPSSLSGGECQRACIARALTTRPKLLIGDEATSALDLIVQKEILDLLWNLSKTEQFSILFISHDPSAVYYLCSRVLVMQRGKILEEGPTEEIFSSPKTSYTKCLLGREI